jgi:hypothetical protein
VKVAVASPTNYYHRVWQERNPTPPNEEPKPADAAAISEIERQVKEDVKNAVVALLPVIGPGEDPFPQVTVTSFQHITTAPPPVPGIEDHAMVWVGQYWSTLGMGGLAVVSLLLLRSVVRSAPAPNQSPAMSGSASSAVSLSLVAGDDNFGEELDEPEEPAAKPKSRLKRRAVNGPSLREELATMVKEDPDAAVAVLRNWIGAGA